MPTEFPRLQDLSDSAYDGGQGDPLFGRFGHDGYDYEGVTRGEFNYRMRDYNPSEASYYARQELVWRAEDDGKNWGPPPDLNHLHDPGFPEHDPYE